MRPPASGSEAPVFAINILPATTAAAKACRAFAGALGRDVNPFTHPSVSPNISFSQLENTLESSGQDWRSRFLDIPVYKHAKAVIYCCQHKVFSVQDHEIWVARVLHVEINHETVGSDQESIRSADASSLLYQNRRFHEVGSNLPE